MTATERPAAEPPATENPATEHPATENPATEHPATEHPARAADLGLLERARPLALAAGGILFAIGNLMHPLEHDEHAESATLWSAAHIVFSIGALLVVVGLPVITRRLRASKVGLTGSALLWLGMVVMPANAYIEVYVAPNVDHDTLHAIEDDMVLVATLVAVAFILGSLLLGIGALLVRDALPRAAAIAVVAGAVVLAVFPGLPGKEGLWIIPATVVVGLGLAAGALPGRAPHPGRALRGGALPND